MTDSIEKPSGKERSCQSCAVSQMGLENIRATGNLMSGANASCLTCERNPGQEMFAGIMALFGPPTDNWQERKNAVELKESVKTEAIKRKAK